MPQDDSSEFEISMQVPEGSDLQRSAQVIGEVEAKLKALRLEGQPVVIRTLTTIGNTSGRLGKGEGDVTITNLYCKLPELGGFWDTYLGKTRKWSQFQAMAMARKILAQYPDVRGSVQLLTGVSTGGGRNSDLQFNLVGPDLAQLTEYADDFLAKLRAKPGFVDVDTMMSNRKPELRIEIDREKASQFGLQIEDIANTLRTLIGGEIVGNFRENDDLYDVWLRARPSDRSSQEALEDITLRLPDGKGLVQLSNFVKFRESRGPNQIDRFQRQRKITIVANLVDKGLGEAISDVKEIAREMNLPAGYDTVFTGRAKTLQETGANFLIAFGLAMIFMYMILAAQFENFVQPISILLAVPLSLPFALVTMILLNEPLNIYAIFGLFMLFGMVKKNGILQVDYTNTLRARGIERDEAILQANRARLRPILMTTLMLVASMIPIALGQGPGSGGRASMAKIIIGGQLLCLLLSLLVTPVSYSIFDDWSQGRFFRRRKKVKAEDPAVDGKELEAAAA
jgi:HAE1 family hydrophobic/amphiphilic exporter-1